MTTLLQRFTVHTIRPLLALSCFIGIWYSQSTAQDLTEPFEGFDDYVNNAMKISRVPGAAIAVVNADEVLYIKGYGVREAGRRGVVDQDTVFAVGSIGKTFTSLMLGALQDEEILRFNDPIVKHLPEFHMSDAYVTKNITFKDAVSHLSGLREFPALGAGLLLGGTQKENVRLVSELEFSHSLRERFAYTNVMYAVVAEAASKATGKPYHTLMRERVFDPLSMNRSDTTLNVTKGRNVAAHHVFVDGVATAVPYQDIDGIAAAGSLNSTAADMANFVRMMMNDGEFNDRQIVSTQSVSDIQRFYRLLLDDEFVDVQQLYEYIEDPSRVSELGYGMSVMHMNYDGSPYYMTGGSNGGMTAYIKWSKEDNIGVIILSNSENFLFPMMLSFALLNPMIDLPLDDALGRLAPLVSEFIADPQPPEIEFPATPSHRSADMVGDYENINGSFSVSKNGDQLKIKTARTHYEGNLRHLNGDFYWVEWEHAALAPLILEAETSPMGQISGLREAPYRGMLQFAPDPLFIRKN